MQEMCFWVDFFSPFSLEFKTFEQKLSDKPRPRTNKVLDTFFSEILIVRNFLDLMGNGMPIEFGILIVVFLSLGLSICNSRLPYFKTTGHYFIRR